MVSSCLMADTPLTVEAPDTPVGFESVPPVVVFELFPELFELVPPFEFSDPFAFEYSDPFFAFPELAECVPPGGF